MTRGTVVDSFMEQPEIRLLSDSVINKIAAGEVVDRPASVAKELIENALDAGATVIKVEIAEGGKKRIAIVDNGCGMTRDNALLSIERHATSKIRSDGDIVRIATMGFRGEALSAISAVSRFTLTTRPESELNGTKLFIECGRLTDVSDTGCPVGTSMEVNNLFCNVPARRKFLRSESTELSHIRQLFLTYAMAYPEHAWTLKVDGRILHQLPGGVALLERMRELFEPELTVALQMIDAEMNRVKVHGYISRPGYSRSDRSAQYVFINHRPASAALITMALREACSDVFPRNRHPAMVLFVDVPPEAVDVNVHPAKSEVRFRYPQTIREAVVEGVRRALSGGSEDGEVETDLRPKEVVSVPGPVRPVPRPAVAASRPSFGTQLNFSLDKAPQTAPRVVARLNNIPPVAQTSTDEPEPWNQPSVQPVVPEEPPLSGPWGRYRIIGSMQRYYLVETADGLVIVDPAAAHERVVYERILANMHQHSVAAQSLLLAETLELSPLDAERVRQNIDVLNSIGFSLDEFGNDTFIVDAVPEAMNTLHARECILDILAEMDDGGSVKKKWNTEKAAAAASAASINRTKRISEQEFYYIMQKLSECEMPYTSAHGRPTIVLTSFQELDRKFGIR
ncbi:MAG: DNA mismatch repair endonuclease MutL [Spartobacteria bacterium]|nr:DNA mismatch repair endonuclease MutL [Spartobacteria bacterium]